MLFTEIIAAYSENHTKPINILCVQNVELQIAKAGFTNIKLDLYNQKTKFTTFLNLYSSKIII
jgi:hypothetical protein